MDEFEKFYNKTLRFLSYRPRSEKELRDKLKKKKTSGEIINKIILRLKENNFINDEEFVKWWIEQRTTFKPRSFRLIKMELKQKGVSNDLIEKVIDDLRLTIDDLKSAKKLIQKRLSRYKNLPREKKFQKIARFLSSRGFDYDIIKEIFKSYK
ncbi:MAG: hypothetical protein A3B44_03820 [Candidatus Levybacteria bacterium RIFCSPLOWO2_01_FULL_38_21]|nr:MAG: hypothetical protein A3B44_03820 [Candidatus Levybacteria bacterium RIFCSPLOWO2_01_FULL_38_21]